MLGFSGLIILFDEAERIPSIANVTDGYINLIRLIYKSINLPRVCFIYATTPQFYDDAKRNFKYFETEENKELLKEIYDRMENKKLILSLLSKNQLIELANKIFEIYTISRNKLNDNRLLSKWQNSYTDIYNLCDKKQTMRDFTTEIYKNIKLMDN